MTGKGCKYCPAVKPCMVSKYRGSLCAAIRADFGVFTDPDKDVPGTIADHIRDMSDEELVEFLWSAYCFGVETTIRFCTDRECLCHDVEDCKLCLLAKLQQPYESPTVEKG